MRERPTLKEENVEQPRGVSGRWLVIVILIIVAILVIAVVTGFVLLHPRPATTQGA